MKIAVWSGLDRIGPYVTGVGKHIVNVTRGLASQQSYNVRLLLPAGGHKPGAGHQVESPLADVPGVELPLSRRKLEVLWQTIKTPKIDRWSGGADWIYCPKETYVPVQHARYAVTVHDLYALDQEPCYNMRRIDHRRRRDLLKRTLNDATVVLAVSEFTRSRIIVLLGTAPEKIRVVGNGVEQGFFQPVANSNPFCTADLSDRYVLSVGGLTRKKGARNLLSLSEILAQRAPELDLVVIGPVESEYEGALRGAHNVRHLKRGFADTEMRALVGRAAASITLSEYEGFGIPPLEAMAAGVPVIAARRASLPEVIGDAGILVDPIDPRAVSDAILTAVQNEPVRCELIERGRRRARQFTWDACVARVAAALEEFSGSRPNQA